MQYISTYVVVRTWHQNVNQWNHWSRFASYSFLLCADVHCILEKLAVVKSFCQIVFGWSFWEIALSMSETVDDTTKITLDCIVKFSLLYDVEHNLLAIAVHIFVYWKLQ